jgi:hypothetical protein
LHNGIVYEKWVLDIKFSYLFRIKTEILIFN